MKKRIVKRALCTLLAAAMLASSTTAGWAFVPGVSQKQSTGGAASGNADRATPSDADKGGDNFSESILYAKRQWEISNTGNDEVFQILDDGSFQFKSGTGNDNKNNPAILLSKEYKTVTDGTLSFTVTSNDVPKNTRFGVFLRYRKVSAGDAPHQGVFVGFDAEGWFWQKYDGTGNSWYTGVRKAAPGKSEPVQVTVELSGDTMNVTVDGDSVFANEPVPTISNAGGIAFRAGSWGSVQTAVNLSGISFEEPATGIFQVSGKITHDGSPVKGAAITADSRPATTEEDGTYSFRGLKGGGRNLTVAKEGFLTITHPLTLEEDVTDLDYVFTAVGDGVVIRSESMAVTVDTGFPRVIRYSYKGKVMAGQEKPLDMFVINGVKVKPAVTSVISDDKIGYVMTFLDKINRIDAVITAEFVVKDNTLEFNITNIEDNRIVKTIEMPGNNLISVKGTSDSAAFAGANMANNTRISGDTFSKISDLDDGMRGYMYAFLSDGTLSGGLWSNSENNVNADWQRVTLNVTTEGNVKNAGLYSTRWTYQKDAQYRKEDGKMELDDGTVLPIDELPSAKVTITDDVNGDGTADWQDGAIAYRSIMNNPRGSLLVPELVAYRINMTFASQAQNPFLMALDGVKKVSLNTGGLGQSILLKGYGSEGHDSGHLNYADIGQRIGGAKDMKTLLARGKEYGAKFGIHVNASETYPESKYFEEERLKKNGDGTYSYGWNWLDQGININADYDLRHGRAQRFKDLYDELGGPDNDLSWVYVDVWGNGQSGDNGTWPSRQLAKEITALGWNVAGEWGHANEYDSIFQHWASDLTYGGYTNKGINSNIARFIRNHQKDSWAGNYPAYGGAAEAPLFGGYSMKDFEGWQGRSDYKAYVNNLFEVNVASKYVQHFLATNIKYGTPVTIQGSSWNPEMELVLKSREDDRNGILKITRGSNDYAGDRDGYRTRTFELNGKKIFKGQEGDAAYLIPWIWDTEGNVMDAAKQKLYHWNTKGGTTGWELPEGWEDVSSVYVYELTELGKTNRKEVPVTGGKVELEAERQTPYVLYRGEMDNEVVNWSEGMHIVDSGFNSENLDAWIVTGGGASVVKSQGSNPMLAISDNTETVSVSQTLTGLEPNTKYAAYVGVDNRSDTEVVMEIGNGVTVASNSAPRSIARNFVQAYAHSTLMSTATVGNTSFFQHMYVFFETGAAADNVTLTIKRGPGEGTSYLDDIRIVANESNNYPSEGVFIQDFETVPQGIWPFVIGNREGVQDNRTHLSELHVPYTQRGWNGKGVNDVIQGKWSVKTNGLAGRKGLIYQTIPQNFKFKPGVDYAVSFDYESGSDDTYAVVTGSKPYENGGPDTQINLKNTIDLTGPGKCTFTLTGADNAQSWFGIESTGIQADTRGVTNGNQINFNGYKDFMLDNLVISTASGQKGELRALIAKAQLLSEENFDGASWSAFKFALDTALTVNDDVNAAQHRVDESVKALEKAMGVPADQAAVTVRAAGWEETVQTGADGNYRFDNVRVYPYQMTVTKAGYDTVTVNGRGTAPHPR